MQRHEREEFERATILVSETSLFRFLKVVSGLILILLSWWVVPLEVLVRREFGERYLGTIRIIVGVSVYFWFLSLMAAIDGNFSNVMLLLFVVWLAAAAYHKWVIWRRTKDRIPWHSYSFGSSNLYGRLPGDDWMLLRAVEPLLFGTIGVLLWLTFHRALGIYFVGGAVGMMMRAQMFYSTYRDQYLDRMDSLIEAEYWSGDHKGTEKEVTAGFSPVRMSADMTAMIERSEAELARRGVRVPVTAAAQPFEDIDTAVRATMTSVETRPIPVIKRDESELEAPAGAGRSRLTPRPAQTSEPVISPAQEQSPSPAVSPPATDLRSSLVTDLETQTPTTTPQPTQTTPPPKPEGEWSDY